MTDPKADSGDRAQIFRPKGAGTKSGYELHDQGGASTRARGAPAAPPPRPKAAGGAPASSSAESAPTNSNKAQGQALAETVVSSLIERMTAVAESKGGTLTLQDIQNLGAEFQKQTTALSTVFEKTLNQSAKTAKSKNWDQLRKAPFDRIVVKTFSHLFADGTQLTEQKKGLSRRMLPGFFVALGMMLGEENLRGLQDRCRDILDRLRQEKGDAFEWTDFYEDAEARPLMVDAMVSIALHFENMSRREGWFIDIVNTHLGPADDPNAPAVRW